MGNIWVIYGLYILCCACVSVILLRLYLCAFNDTQPHIVVDVLDNPTTRLELYLITLVNSWLAVSMSGADHVVGSELCVFVVHVRVVNVECVLRTLRQKVVSKVVSKVVNANQSISGPPEPSRATVVPQ